MCIYVCVCAHFLQCTQLYFVVHCSSSIVCDMMSCLIRILWFPPLQCALLVASMQCWGSLHLIDRRRHLSPPEGNGGASAPPSEVDRSNGSERVLRRNFHTELNCLASSLPQVLTRNLIGVNVPDVASLLSNVPDSCRGFCCSTSPSLSTALLFAEY